MMSLLQAVLHFGSFRATEHTCADQLAAAGSLAMLIASGMTLFANQLSECFSSSPITNVINANLSDLQSKTRCSVEIAAIIRQG